MMHVGAGAEAGYDTNVFYQTPPTVSSPIIRATSFVEDPNASRTGVDRAVSGSMRGPGVQYRRYSGTDSRLDAYRNAWMPVAGLSLSTTASPTVSFGFADAFRQERGCPVQPGPAPAPSATTIRRPPRCDGRRGGDDSESDFAT